MKGKIKSWSREVFVKLESTGVAAEASVEALALIEEDRGLNQEELEENLWLL